MHAALTDFTLERPNSLGWQAWLPLLHRCGRELDGIAPRLWGRLTYETCEVLTRWPEDTGHNRGPVVSLPRGVIHADLFPDNVLMRGSGVTGLIDFYFACTDIRAYDLAVMHTSWSFDAAGVPADPAVGDALVAGYQSTFDLSTDERDKLPTLCKGACVRFALTRAWDWLNTPADALVTRKDPLAYLRRLDWYDDNPEAFA